MKKLILLLVVLGFLKWEVKAQAVEWVLPVSNGGQPTLNYVNDSTIIITTMTTTSCQGACNAPQLLSKINSDGKIILTRYSNYILAQNGFISSQIFTLPNSRFLYSGGQFIIDNDLKITTVDGFLTNYCQSICPNNLGHPSIYASSENRLNDYIFEIEASSPPYSQYPYILKNRKNTTISNHIIMDGCFYKSRGVIGESFIDKKKTFYFSFLVDKKDINSGLSCDNNNPNYIATNTVGGVQMSYTSQYEAASQTIISYDTNNNIKLLPFYDVNYCPLCASVPEHFGEDSKGNLIVAGYYGTIGKYRKNPWDSIWIKKLSSVERFSRIFVDKKDNIFLATQSRVLTKLDSNGLKVWEKPLGLRVADIQTDHKNSIYVAGYFVNSFDCYTLSGNAIIKLYEGTLPSTPKLTKSDLVLKSNFPRGVTWYRNDSLLTSENDTFAFALRDGKYTFKAFCKQDTLNFNGISYPNGALKTFSISGATYQWYLNEVPIPNAVSHIHTPTSIGKYTVKINFDKNQALFSSGRANSTNAYQAVYSLNLVQLSVEDDDFQTASGYFSLFPNPTTQTLTIKTAGFTQMPQAQVLNALGQEVTSLSLSSELSSVDVSSFPKGIYSIKVGSQVQKLVVE